MIIMGCPGAGKSTVGVIVAEMLEMKYVDFDLNVLEPAWGMKVADKVAIDWYILIFSNINIILYTINFDHHLCNNFSSVPKSFCLVGGVVYKSFNFLIANFQLTKGLFTSRASPANRADSILLPLMGA